MKPPHPEPSINQMNGHAYVRNEEHLVSQKSVEAVFSLMSRLGVRNIPSYWADIHNFTHGATHRIKGINAYVKQE